MFVANFEAVGRVTSVLEPENRPASLAQKAVSVKNGLSTAKNISYGCMSQDSRSSQPTTFNRDEVHFFFFFFFSS